MYKQFRGNKALQFVLLFFINVVFILILKIIFFLTSLSDYSVSELSSIYPLFYSLVYGFVQNTEILFLIWFLLLIFINGLLTFIFIRLYNLVREFLLASLVTLFLLLAAEYGLRSYGFQPGAHTYVRYFNKTDSLFFKDGFEVDSNGIVKISKTAKQNIAESIKKNSGKFDKSRNSVEIYCLASENIALIEGKTENSFSKYFRELKMKNKAALSQLDNAVLEYVYNPINDEGFRSIPFRNFVSDKPKILLLGDSFSWGHSASPISSCFADELLAKGYVVYNTGISATDVAQYLTIAKKYISRLKPDIVIVNFYLGNDVNYYRREVKPGTAPFFCTSAGMLMAHPLGEYFKNAEDAYNHYLNLWFIDKEKNVFNKIMAQTVITTLVWRFLLNMKIINNKNPEIDDYHRRNELLKLSFPYCNEELKEIRNIVLQNNARFILSCIPEVYRFTFRTKKDFPDLFTGINYIEMDVNKSDYNLDDGHFNERGHKRYCDFLIQHIEKGE